MKHHYYLLKVKQQPIDQWYAYSWLTTAPKDFKIISLFNRLVMSVPDYEGYSGSASCVPN